MNMKRSFALAALAALALALISIPALAAGALDGKTFTAQVGEKGKDKGDAEDIIFKDGMFRSTGCDQYGFTEAAYTATAAGETITWESTSTSPKEGKMHWKGTVKGDTIEGSAHWVKAGQKPIEYWVKGSLKK
jgi:hypothetical protein